VAFASVAAALLAALCGVAVLLPLSDRRAEPPAVPGESWWHLASGSTIRYVHRAPDDDQGSP